MTESYKQQEDQRRRSLKNFAQRLKYGLDSTAQFFTLIDAVDALSVASLLFFDEFENQTRTERGENDTFLVHSVESSVASTSFSFRTEYPSNLLKVITEDRAK
jgi:hypothetical protein